MDKHVFGFDIDKYALGLTLEHPTDAMPIPRMQLAVNMPAAVAVLVLRTLADSIEREHSTAPIAGMVGDQPYSTMTGILNYKDPG